jgi:hypothetical protein
MSSELLDETVKKLLENHDYFEKKRKEKDAFIDKLKLSDIEKLMFKRSTPHDAFDHLDNPIERFFFVQSKLGECKSIEDSDEQGVSEEWKGLKEVYHRFQLFWKDEAKDAAKTLKEFIQLARGAEFDKVKFKENDILLAAQEMGVDSLFTPELFANKETKGNKPGIVNKISSWKDVTFKYDSKTTLVKAHIKGKQFETINPTNLKGCTKNGKITPRWGHFLNLIEGETVKPTQRQRINESLADFFRLPKEFPPCFKKAGCSANIPLKHSAKLHSRGSKRRGGNEFLNQDDTVSGDYD